MQRVSIQCPSSGRIPAVAPNRPSPRSSIAALPPVPARTTGNRQARSPTCRAAKEDEAGAIERALDGVLPEKEPGEFPKTGVHPDGWDQQSMTEDEEPFDPLRDGPLRYLGYANELGEAFSAFLPPGGVPFSYAVAIAYVLVDTADKGLAAKRESEAQLEQKSSAIPTGVDTDRLSSVLAAERALDTVVWQLLASVAIPGFTIHQVVAITYALLHPHLQHLGAVETDAIAQIAASTHLEAAVVLQQVEKTIPTIMGLGTIPFIVHPIDESVHLLLDKTLRPAMRSLVCETMQGKEAGLDECQDCKEEP